MEEAEASARRRISFLDEAHSAADDGLVLDNFRSREFTTCPLPGFAMGRRR